MPTPQTEGPSLYCFIVGDVQPPNAEKSENEGLSSQSAYQRGYREKAVPEQIIESHIDALI